MVPFDDDDGERWEGWVNVVKYNLAPPWEHAFVCVLL